MAKEKEIDFSDDEFEDWEDENESEEEEKRKKRQKQKESVQLPIFLEIIYSFSLIFTVLLALIVAAMSFLSGAQWLDVFIRTAITILSTGLLLWVFSLTISNGALKTVKVLQKEAIESHLESVKRNQDSEDEEFLNNSQNMDVEDSKE